MLNSVVIVAFVIGFFVVLLLVTFVCSGLIVCCFWLIFVLVVLGLFGVLFGAFVGVVDSFRLWYCGCSGVVGLGVVVLVARLVVGFGCVGAVVG